MQLQITWLEALEQAAYDGRLQQIYGVGPGRVAAVNCNLAEMLQHSTQRGQVDAGETRPDVGLLLEVDAEYRRKAIADELLKEVEKPTPKDNEILIRIYATTVTRYDCWARSCTAHTGLGILMRIWFGIRKPKKPILGTELAGEIEAVGKDVKRFEIGDRVYGYPGMNLGA